LPGEWLVSGLVYDVATGLVEVVVPPAPIRTAQWPRSTLPRHPAVVYLCLVRPRAPCETLGARL